MTPSAKTPTWVGMSGWTYAPWRGHFYPKGLSQKKELEWASGKVTSLEINGTFYALQKPEVFRNWYRQTPPGFVFSVKAPRFVTHIRRLKDFETPLANFLASGLFELKEKLGAILWQLPPNLALKDDRVIKFIEALPHSTADAERVSKNHSDWLEGRSTTSAEGVPRLRHAFEFRHPSFSDADFQKHMRSKNVAMVYADSGENSLPFEEPTADFFYARMHGEGKGFQKGYSRTRLESFHESLQDWRKNYGVKEAYVYFDTEAKQYAPLDAMNYIEMLSGTPAKKKRASSPKKSR